ncbi:hypothetical protein T459_14934 [Capsicum annuum]|uniref:Uncharacterized protein n=1 Tax=Capsicum annuum TaxID=4072 RepID=A0A2G2ZIU1_CAPAN|nr:hypothetical protein T459_14934 [Capsicum annuum]
MNFPSNFNGPTRVEEEASLFSHVDNALIVEFFPFITTQSSLADFGDLVKYEIMKDDLPTFYWFDTGQHLSLPIPFVFRHIKCGGLLYVLEYRNIGDHLVAFDVQDGGVIIIDRDATLLSGDSHRKYMWCFEFVVMKLSSLSAQTCLRYFLLFLIVQKACYILGRANICGTILYSYPMTKVWDPGQFWSVNFYTSGIIEHQTIDVDIRDISSSLASFTSTADILFETFLSTPIVRFLLMVSLNNQTTSSTLTPCDIVLLATDNMRVGNYLILCHLVLVATRRHFKSSFSSHTADLGRRKQQTKQLADKHCDQVIPYKTLISCMQGFDFLFCCSFEFLCTSLVCKMFPSLSISSHVPSSIHEHIRDGVYDRAVWEHSHIESNFLPSHVGILQYVHPESDKIMPLASTFYEAIRANVVVVAGYKTFFMGLFCRTLLRRFFGHQSNAARSIKNSRHMRKFFVYVQYGLLTMLLLVQGVITRILRTEPLEMITLILRLLRDEAISKL